MRYLTYNDLAAAGVITVEEAAHVLRIGRTKAYEMVGEGLIRTLPFDRPKRISAKWLKAFIDGDDAQLPASP